MKIYQLTCQFVAPIKVAGHVTGGAIDIYNKQRW